MQVLHSHLKCIMNTMCFVCIVLHKFTSVAQVLYKHCMLRGTGQFRADAS